MGVCFLVYVFEVYSVDAIQCNAFTKYTEDLNTLNF